MSREHDKIKVMFVIPSLARGGSERQLIFLLKGLSKDCFEPMVVCTRELGEWGEKISSEGYNIISLNSQKPFSPKISYKIHSLIKEHKIDILQSFLFGMDIWASWPARLRKTRVIISRRELAGWMEQKHKLLERLGDWGGDCWVCNSQIVADSVRAREKINESKIVVIPNGVSCPKVIPEKRKIEEKIKIVCLANFSPVKGHGDLLLAGEALKEMGLDFKMTCYGEGPELEQIKGLTKTLDLQNQISFGGTYDDPKGILEESDILVSPSHEEGMPNVVMEAMAMGVPVVATSVGGTSELLAGVGVLVPPKSPNALAEGILQLVSNEELRLLFSEKAFNRIQGKYSPERMIQSYQTLYENLI